MPDEHISFLFGIKQETKAHRAANGFFFNATWSGSVVHESRSKKKYGSGRNRVERC
jgi:hypothetical protein